MAVSNAELDRALKDLEARLSMKVIAETGKVQQALVQDLIAHRIALNAILAEMSTSPEQIGRVRARAVAFAGSSDARKRVAELLTLKMGD